MAQRRSSTSPVRILDAALVVAARDGLGGASLGRIAAESGTSKASVLYHFGSLTELRRAMAERVRERLQSLILEASVTAGNNLEERATAVFDALFAKPNRQLLLAVREVLMMGARDAIVAAEVRRNFDRAAEIVATLVDPSSPMMADRARQVVASVQGHIDLWLSSGDVEPKEFRDSALKTVRAVLGPIPETPPETRRAP